MGIISRWLMIVQVAMRHPRRAPHAARRTPHMCLLRIPDAGETATSGGGPTLSPQPLILCAPITHIQTHYKHLFPNYNGPYTIQFALTYTLFLPPLTTLIAEHLIHQVVGKNPDRLWVQGTRDSQSLICVTYLIKQLLALGNYSVRLMTAARKNGGQVGVQLVCCGTRPLSLSAGNCPPDNHRDNNYLNWIIASACAQRAVMSDAEKIPVNKY